MKPFIRHKRTGAWTGMTPLIDVMFMLLLFFLLTSSFMVPSIALKLPGAGNVDSMEEEVINVSIDAMNRIYLGNEMVDMADLEVLLRGQLNLSEKKRVLFRGDENIPYRYFVGVMDILKRSGAREIGIAHERKH